MQCITWNWSTACMMMAPSIQTVIVCFIITRDVVISSSSRPDIRFQFQFQIRSRQKTSELDITYLHDIQPAVGLLV